MNGFTKLYTPSLVAANMATAGVMYLLNSPLFTVVLVALGLLVLVVAALTDDPASRSGSATISQGRRV